MMIATGALPRVSGREWGVLNALAGRQWVFSILEGSADVAIDIWGIRPAQPGSLGFELSGLFGKVELRVDPGAINALSDLCLPGWSEEEPGSLPGVWQCAVALDALSGAARMARWLGGVKPLDHPPGEAGRDARWLSGTVLIQGTSHEFAIRLITCSEALAIRMAGQGAALSSEGRINAALPSVPVNIGVPVGRFTGSELRRCEPGDVITMGAGEAGHLAARIRLGGGAEIAAVLDSDGRLKVKEIVSKQEALLAGHPEFPPDEEEDFPNLEADKHDDYPESQQDEPDPDADAFPEDAWDTAETGGEADEQEIISDPEQPPEPDPLAPAAFGDLAVAIELRFASRQLSLAEAQSLAPGQILDLAINLADPVEILANGRRFGSGRLIEIGDVLGVQLVSWPRGDRGG